MSTLTTTPTADDFRALAHSSPWLFTTLHWRHGDVEAWLDRPAGRVTVRRADGLVEVAEGVPYSTTALTFPVTSGGAEDTATSRDAGAADDKGDDVSDPAGPAASDDGVVRRADGVVRRADGLVVARPHDWHYHHGDPMWGNYVWTAMLDPVELADGADLDAQRPRQDVMGVLVSEVQEVTHRGRRTWQAVCRPVVDVYDPRCGCCPLLDSVASRLLEYGPDDPNLAADRDSLPTAYLVSLDVRTGIVVDLTPLDGIGGSSLTNEIYAVDEVLTAPPVAP